MKIEDIFYQIKDALIVCTFETDPLGVEIQAVNSSASELLGMSIEELRHLPLKQIFDFNEERMKECLDREIPQDWDETIELNGPFNIPKYCNVNYYPVDDQGRNSLMLTVRDISLEQRHLERLGIFRGIYNNSSEGIMIFNASGKLEWINKTMVNITGVSKHLMLGMTVDVLMDFYPQLNLWGPIHHVFKSGQNWSGELWDAQEHDFSKVLNLKIFEIKNDAFLEKYIVAAATDVTEMKKKEREIEYLSYRDRLTGLFNLRYFMENIEKESRMKDKAVYFIDIEGFGQINDTYGHHQGDKILKIVASRLMGNIRGNELLGRVGNDKFVVCSEYHCDILPEERGKQLLEVFHKTINFEEKQVQLTANLGYAISPRNGKRVSDLIKAAEIATKHAKPIGLNRLGAYDLVEAQRLSEKYQLGHDIKMALERKEMYIMFQPIVNSENGTIAGFETLARWRHNTLGEISPSKFIPLAEQSGVINALGDWVIAETFNCLKTINDMRKTPIFASINLSIRQLEQRDFIKHVKKMLTHYGIDGRNVEFEITESVYMENIDAIFENLKALNELGIRISIDDFGTGYSSLSQLYRIDVSKIKIDKSFIDGLSLREECDRLTEAVTLIAKSFNLKLVAEGVETELQLDALKKLKCDYIQGYFFSKPLNLGDFCSYLDIEVE